MPGNGKVFVCHAPEDIYLCQPVLAALDAWGIEYFFDPSAPTGGTAQLSDRTQQAIAERDVFLRICTAALQRSLTASYEVNAFRSLQAEDKRRGKGDRRALVNLILDRGYVREPIDSATLFVDGTSRPRPIWLGELGRALGAGTASRRFSRRSLFAYGATAVVSVASLSAGGALALDYSARTAEKPNYLPGQAIWHLEDGKQVPPTPAAADGVVYTINDIACAAYVATSGRNIWKNVEEGIQKSGSSAVVSGGTAYFGVDTSVVALRTSDGVKRWSWVPDDGGPDILMGSEGNGVVYLLSDGGTLYAVDAASGHTRWSAPVGAVNFNENTSEPVVTGGKVYIGLLDATVHAYDATSGSLAWKFATRGPIHSTPSVWAGTVYIGSLDGALYALDAGNGALRWKYQTGGSIYAPPLAQDGIVFVGSRDGNFYAFDASSGRAFWGTPVNPGDTPAQVDGSPAIVNTKVYMTVQQVVYGYRVVDGQQVLAHRAEGKDYATDVVATQGLLFYGTSTFASTTTKALNALYAIGG
jgi:eukaryotic-like serine/threonine-protein kinase